MTQLIRGAVLEGCSASGKTSVLKALKLRQAQLDLERSVAVLGEHYSQALQNFHGEHRWLSQDNHQLILTERIEALESLERWSSAMGPASRQARGVFFVLERFHLNHRLTYEEDVDWVEETETRLEKLYAVCFLLTVSEPHVADRLTFRLRTAGKPHGAQAVELATRQFLEQQQRLLRAADRASVPTVVLCTDDQNWTRCADVILERLISE